MRLFFALLSTNLQAVLALRTTFWIQALFMALNNVIFFVFWWVLFERFDEIRGWRIEDVAALFGVSAAGFGMARIFAGGLDGLAERIDGGQLDPLLVQPRSVLLMTLGSRTNADGWGDVLSGFVLLAFSGYLSGVGLVLAPLAVLLSGLAFTASGLLINCLAFWLGRVDDLARLIWDFLLVFSVYPPSLFGGALRVVLYTLIPAGFVAYLPTELLRNPAVNTLVIASLGAALYAVLAAWVFSRGLRVYASGSRFGVRD
ncbi:MAG: ABC-2 family transporter protein [Myxococcota bacterium]